MSWDLLGGAAGPPGAPGTAGVPGAPGTSFGNTLIAGGGVLNTTGYTYVVTAATYAILGVTYSSPQTTLTLTAADGALDRIDVLAVNSSGAAVVVTGVAAANPAEPTLDPATQVKVDFIYVTAGSSGAATTTTSIYLEDTEWTTTSSGARIVKNSTNNPYAGTKDVEATLAVNGDNIIFSNGSTFDTSTRNVLAFFIQSKASWPNAKSIVIQWYNGTTARGTAVTLKQGAYAFDSTNVSSYQLIVVPMTAFGVAGITVDRIKFTVTGGGAGIGWYIDNIIAQAGVGLFLPTGNMTWRGGYSAAVQYVLNDVVTASSIAYVSLGTQLGVTPYGAATWAPLSGGSGTGSVTTVSVVSANGFSGSVATATSTPAITLSPQVTQTLTDAATIAWNVATGPVAKVTLGAARTLGAPTNLIDGGTYILRVIQDGTGGWTLAYNAVFKWPGGTAPVLSTAIAAIDVLTFVSDGTNLYGVAQKAFA